MPRTRFAAPLALVAALTLTACTTTVSDPAATAPAGGVAAANASTDADMRFDPATVGAQLDAIRVAPVDPYNGYDRVGDFGQAWADVDHNGCDTRSDILRRDLTQVTPSTGCTVDTGVLVDPYSGTTVHYTRGAVSSQAVQIDHVVPVYEAWRTGAQHWSQATRIEFANDPLNLLAVDGAANQAKGDLDPSRWLPPRASYRCEYVERYVTVLAKYRLTVPNDEKAALIRLVDGCPS
ncbi:MAG: HNH endonuclease family protein [Microbacteriaceae bacterium]|nr:HNH endonuclease family protein [Microbacteriaceae bacterium]